MPSSAIVIVGVPLILALALFAAFGAYLVIRYAPIIGRIFEEKPLFLPLHVPAIEVGEEVLLTADDGIVLAGSYFPSRERPRVGVLVFCHEYLSDRWSFRPYTDHLRDLGFDIFTFDFRNHGDSGTAPHYHPLQWVSDHEVRDLRAVLAYLRSRPDRDPAGVGLLGVSRGGSTALVVAADDPGVWGVVTDGAFPTRGTMYAYCLRWAEIYVNTRFHRYLPGWVIRFVGWAARIRSSRRLGCRFPDVERAVRRIAPRPWLQIHGAKDAYIGPEIARRFFAEAREPKDLWLVPNAKHNRCREIEPEAYVERLSTFFNRYAPRRPHPARSFALDPANQAESSSLSTRHDKPSTSPSGSFLGELAAPVSG